MKKIIVLVIMIATLATMLVACSSFTCDLCGKKKSGDKHTETVFGEKVTYCDDCYDLFH